MFDIWSKNIRRNVELVQKDAGPALAIIVSGSEADRAYWREHLARTTLDIFRGDGSTLVASVREAHLKGNFLGTFNAWAETQPLLDRGGIDRPETALMSMVFGKGTRLSPFTQALGNRKPAFPTPMKGPRSGLYLRTVDLANLYANAWLQHLSDDGFRGLIVKWGDEAVIPGLRWNPGASGLRQVDAVRFVWLTEPTEDLAREKEWVVIDAQTGLMRTQFSRQDLHTLRARVAELGERECRVGVNLGSLAISFQFLEIALDLLSDDVRDPTKWANWDPYAWIALSCRDESEWRVEAEREQRLGRSGIQELEARYPDFYQKLATVRAALESKTGRPLAVGVVDFGETFWADLGLHRTLREMMDALTTETDRGRTTRELFGLPHRRDRKGNILLRSTIPAGADIRDSVLVDSVISDQDSVVHRGVVIGGRHGRVFMPDGGCALFSAVDRLAFSGPHGVAFRSLGAEVTIPAGGRHTTLLLPHGPEHLVSNEAIVDYGGRNYSEPILSNRLSFEEAGEIMSRVEGQELERQWLRAWQGG